MPRFVDLISVIIPVYNAEPYLERCLNSVMNQDYPNIEIVLVNDGSTDGSLSICENYAMRNPDKFRILNQCNTGASIARKNGIEVSKGEYLMFVDSDDFVAKNYISALYSGIQAYNSKISICSSQRLNPNEVPQEQTEIQRRIITSKELFERFFKYEFWAFWGGCYHKSVFDNINFPPGTINEDYYVKCQIFTNEENVVLIDNALYYYEVHVGSLSNQTLSLRALSEFDNALRCWEFVCENNNKYSDYSLSIVAEVCSKWMIPLYSYLQDSLVDGNKEIYYGYYRRIRKFVINHFFSIIVNFHLLWKVKIILLKNLLLYSI